MIKHFENTFIHGPSPSYSEDAASENAIPVEEHQKSSENFLDQKFSIYSENQMHQPYRIKGRNTFAFWTIVTLLLILTVGNLILTFTIIGVLRLGKGIQGMEMIPEVGVLKFTGLTDLDRIYNKCGGQIDGFSDVPVTITGDEEGVTIKVNRNGQTHSKMTIDKEGISFKGVNTFEIKDPNNGDAIFTTHRPHYNIPQGANNLQVKATSASRITSPIGHPLNIQSDNKIFVKGSEGINLDGFSSLFAAETYILMNSTQGATFMTAGDGIFLDMEKVPIINTEFGIRTGSVQYKICVCMPQGLLFRIAIPRTHNGSKISCAHFSSKHDPCA